MARITLSNLAHSYLPKPRGEADFALKEMDHVWQDGGAYALLGASGCGKTTLLNIISGLLRPSRGRVLFGERDVTDAPTAERNIAQVFQFPVVYDTMTVRENLAFPLRNRGRDAAYVEARVGQIARMIGMEGALDTRARGLTADAKQKISLGRGMVREDVNAILFDEPLTVIDPHMKWELRTQLKRLHREFGHTMIYVTHDQTEALTFADKVVVMHEGRVVQTGTPEELFETPGHTFVGYFIGSPGMNLFEAEVSGDMARVMGHPVPLGATYPPTGGRVQIGIRPEFVSLADAGLPVTIRRVEDVGRHRILRGEAFGQPVYLLLPEDRPATTGSAFLHLAPEKINVYADDWRVQPVGDRRAA
ncbi:ABC transporter ATP-binding protein [Cereibacter sediminicola]|uniref:ABC transporter ATP-binding protein n=1 Tax=Cereibacter sediminicola TaxID=2584941 RepID=UPI0011A372DC|nr:ABC transporter ATP-binding protein [Cereibacter sediminicola]